MRRPLLLAPLLLLLLTGCGLTPDDGPRALDPANAPFNVFESPQTEAPEGDGRVGLYFVRNDRVVFSTRAVEQSLSDKELLELLISGPTPEQIAEGTSTRIPAGLTVEGVEVGDNGVAVVELSDVGTQSAGQLGYAQIVATLVPSRAEAVRFRLDGVDLPVPAGDGVLTDAPLTREDYAELLPSPPPPPPPPPAVAPAGAGSPVPAQSPA